MAKNSIVLAAALAALASPYAAARAQSAGSPPAATAPRAAVAEVNAFNRLLKPAAKNNLPPSADGIHDPASPGTPLLQAPLEAFGPLPKSAAGNHIDWVKAKESGKIRPRWDIKDAKAQAEALDMDIVREVKGSMPDVVFSHGKHTVLLDCSSCHPAIFEMQKGANKMSMATVMLGGGCGACHGRVAFPVSQCRLCHSKPKARAGTAAMTGSK